MTSFHGAICTTMYFSKLKCSSFLGNHAFRTTTIYNINASCILNTHKRPKTQDECKIHKHTDVAVTNTVKRLIFACDEFSWSVENHEM